jgi:hypothetical protein
MVSGGCVRGGHEPSLFLRYSQRTIAAVYGGAASQQSSH